MSKALLIMQEGAKIGATGNFVWQRGGGAR